MNHDTPTRAASHPPNRKLNFGSSDLHPSVERSPQKGGLKRISLGSGKKGKKRPFDLSLDDDEEDEVSSVMSGAETTNGHIYDDTAPPGIEDDSLQMTQADHYQEAVEDDHFAEEQEQDQSASMEPEPAPEPVAKPKKRKGRPSKVEKLDVDQSQISIAPEKPVVAPEKPIRRKGRPPKKAKTEVYQDEEAQGQPESSRAMEQATPIKKTKAAKPPPSMRDPNAKIKAAPRTKEKQPPVRPMPPPPQRDGRPQPRSLQILRSETPADDEGSRTTRFGRHSVKPLAFWRGERFVYGEGHLEGKELTLPAIKEIIRTEEVVVPRPKRQAYRRPGHHQRRQLDDLEEEDEEREPWETETGIVRAQVMQWDPTTGRGDEERIEEAGTSLFPLPRAHLTNTSQTSPTPPKP